MSVIAESVFTVAGLDTVLKAVIALVVVYVGFLQYKMSIKVSQTEKSSHVAADESVTAVEMAKNNMELTKSTYLYVNSAMGSQLRQVAALHRKIARMPGATQEDQEAADESQHAYDTHMTAQKTIAANI